MTIAWTEKFSNWEGASTPVWVDYDIYTNQGVPKGAIAEIINGNHNKTSEVTMGVRKDGSALVRSLAIHESEDNSDDAYTFMRQLVYVDASTGLIEYITNAAATFFLTGYWTGLAWTETWFILSFVKGDNGIWKDFDLYYLCSIPKGSVCHVIGANAATGSPAYIGVRINGSSLNRHYTTLTEAESGGVATKAMFVKTNATDGIIEAYCTAYGTNTYYVDGYFDNTMDYAEGYYQFTSLTLSAWTDLDITAYLDQDGRVADVIVGNFTVASTATMGLRVNGSGSGNRYILSNEAEDGATEFLPMTTATDASGILEYYTTQSYTSVYFFGYFKFTTVGAGWKKLQYYTEPPTTGAWNKLKFASEPPVPGAWNRLLYAGE